MATNRTIFGRIRDKISRKSTPSSPQTLDVVHVDSDSPSIKSLPSTSNLPSPPDLSLTATPNRPATSVLSSDHNLLTIPNPLPPVSQRDECIAEATSSISPGTVNVVGHDQINVTTHIHMNTAEHDCALHGIVGHNVEKPLLNPLFDKLSHVAKASYDASTPALRRACTENTRTAVLKSTLDWSFDPTKANIYWMNGMAGTGKTTITYSLSTTLERHNVLMATFFCSRLVDECTKVDRIFPTIAYNLARNYSPLASVILEVLKNDPDIANRTISQQFTELLVKPTRHTARNLAGKPIVVIIDALDECANQTEVQTLLSILFRRSSELPFKIFITSRPEQVVRVGFNRQNPDNYSKLILHDIDRNIVNADIKLYLVERLVEMVDGRSDFQESGDDWPPDDKVDILSRQANGLFIYAKTVCDYIGEPGGNISAQLNNASRTRSGSISDALDTSELDRLYRDILDRAIPIRPKARDNLRQILSAIVSIRNPLSARGLGMFLDIDPGMIKSALGSLHSVITVPQSLDAPVSTFHASFPDCLAEPTRSLQHYLPPPQSHKMLAKRCLSLMIPSLKANICDLQGRPANDTIANETISTHIPEGLAYSCMYWASHLNGAVKDEIRNADDVRQLLGVFLREHVLHWMECLSLLRQLHVAVESLRVIEGWALNVYPEMSPMITDARRFVVENFGLISDYCLETYHSALVWLPVQSLIRKHHSTQKPELPIVILGLRNSWGGCERTMICGGQVNSVAISSDGSRIVSGSNNKTIQIWNAATGELESGLEGHSDFVRCVALSSDDNLVVSGSDDKTVRMWDAMTGESEGVFEGHSDSVISVAFSCDGRRVVSGSKDKTVKIWNAATGESECDLMGHSGSVTSVSFSSDGDHVVSGSYDKTARIWEAATGKLESVLEGHTGIVTSVSFSRDGIHIVSGSYDKTVRMWNVATGKLERVLEGHSGFVSSVAFSRDGSRIVSGSYDKTVWIWNAATGESDGVLNGHSGLVSSVSFSRDGSHIVSGSYDKTVRTWKVGTGALEGGIEGHSRRVCSMAFSRDGSRIASGSHDKTIRVWDALSGESERVLEGHSDSVTSVAFSSDGSHIVSGSDDKTVRMWNVVTGELEGVLEGHLGGVLCVAFSSGGSHVVSGSKDKTVRVWNAAKGDLDHVLDGDADKAVLLSDQTKIQYRRNGRFKISTAVRDRHGPHPRPSCFLSNDGLWIQTDSPQRRCWIPERYRDFSCSCSCGLKMAFGFRSGNVVIVDLG